MRTGIVVNAGDPRTMADLAAEAEAAGWDGVFFFDAIAIGDVEMYDPWIVLAAMAMRTERVGLGLIVSAPSRRRPWKLARETMTIDWLSGGRLILPVGLGTLDDAGFGNVGDATDIRVRAELLDESLAILEGLWSGEAFAFEGRHYRFGPMTFRPTPVQRPRTRRESRRAPSPEESDDLCRSARTDHPSDAIQRASSVAHPDSPRMQVPAAQRSRIRGLEPHRELKPPGRSSRLAWVWSSTAV
jgi:hypothetical protein